MKLCDHQDFTTFVERAGEYHELLPQFVEKDYYMTEILRVLASEHTNELIFRGGSSLTKGWGLIERFSEDVDVVLNVPYLKDKNKPHGHRARKTRGKKIVNSVATHLSLSIEEGRKSPAQRSASYTYDSLFELQEAVPPTVRLDIALIAGTDPTETRTIDSLISKYLINEGEADTSEDTRSFQIDLLHYRRTFVEKLFAIHSYVSGWLENRNFADATVRHYADLYLLSQEPVVVNMLKSNEYEKIRIDYDKKSLEAKRREYRKPKDLRFKESLAIFPSDEVRVFIEPIYEKECRTLFYSPYPTFDEVLDRFVELREIL